MISLDTKRMIYSFYVNDDSFEHPINKLHFKLLERYIHKFDEVIFCIIIDDRERYDLIQKLKSLSLVYFIKNLLSKYMIIRIIENHWFFITRLQHRWNILTVLRFLHIIKE